MSRQMQHMSLFSVEYMTLEAINFLRENEPPEGYFVGFSGGKDSIVTLELCRMAGVKHEAWYSCTRIDPPEVVRFIKQYYPDVKWAFPAETFWKLIRRKCPPLRLARWCCEELKEKPTRNNPLKYRVVGVRAEESKKRSQRPRVDWMQREKQHIYKPIFHWREWHVWAFIDEHCLSYPSLYDEGFDRIGCVVCPFLMHKNQAKLNKHRDRWPGMYKAFENAVRGWFENDGQQKVGSCKTFEDYMEAYYRGFE